MCRSAVSSLTCRRLFQSFCESLRWVFTKPPAFIFAALATKTLAPAPEPAADRQDRRSVRATSGWTTRRPFICSPDGFAGCQKITKVGAFHPRHSDGKIKGCLPEPTTANQEREQCARTSFQEPGNTREPTLFRAPD